LPKLQEKPSALKKEHPVLKNMKILDFFLFFWVIFALLDPDPATQINADPCGSMRIWIRIRIRIRNPAKKFSFALSCRPRDK
jgi:hypothetical protein